VGDLVVTVVMVGSFVGAAPMIRYLNTRPARPGPARVPTAGSSGTGRAADSPHR
jgi:hypothetical protein